MGQPPVEGVGDAPGGAVLVVVRVAGSMAWRDRNR
jgi:hypothetical protein